MSGGSMNYLYSRMSWEADFTKDTPERKAFGDHLELVIKALHDIEWVDSCDYGAGDENEAIRACLPAIDCRTCTRYMARNDCGSVVTCVNGSQYAPTTPVQMWEKK